MESVKAAVNVLLRYKTYSPIIVKALNLILDDKMNRQALKQCLHENSNDFKTIKLEALNIIIDYAKIILEDDCLTEDEMRVISLLKKYFQIKEGDFYVYGKKSDVEYILTSQLEKMYADGVIDKEEAIMKTDLQELFNLSYNQFLKIVNKVAVNAFNNGARIEDLDTFIKL